MGKKLKSQPRGTTFSAFDGTGAMRFSSEPRSKILGAVNSTATAAPTLRGPAPLPPSWQPALVDGETESSAFIPRFVGLGTRSSGESLASSKRKLSPCCLGVSEGSGRDDKDFYATRDRQGQGLTSKVRRMSDATNPGHPDAMMLPRRRFGLRTDDAPWDEEVSRRRRETQESLQPWLVHRRQPITEADRQDHRQDDRWDHGALGTTSEPAVPRCLPTGPDAQTGAASSHGRSLGMGKSRIDLPPCTQAILGASGPPHRHFDGNGKTYKRIRRGSDLPRN